MRLVDENDSPPQFIPSQYDLEVPEDVTPGYSVASVVAVDADREGTLLYSLVTGDHTNTFSVDAAKGQSF